jgi:RNA polymerase sigma factor (sigma-70 family)
MREMNRPPEKVLDEWLVLRAQGGDEDAFAALVLRWQRRLTRHALHLTGREDAAADMVQETWLVVAQNIHRLEDPAYFSRWVLQITSCKCADWVRGQQRHRKVVKELGANRGEATPQKAVASDDDIARLREGLRHLPNDRRALLSMYYLDGLSIAEIAEALGVPPGTVKSRLHHARLELKELLERSAS